MTRKIIGAVFQSVDGVMQAPGGPEEDPTGGFQLGGWLTTMFDEGIGNQVDTVFGQPFDLLLGRRTYDIFAAHWPYQAADDPLAAALNRAAKYVLSGAALTSDWQNSHRLRDMDAVAELKRGAGPNLVIQGSSTLYPQLVADGLLDRLITMTAPVLLGRGKRVFGDGTVPRMLKIIEQRTTAGGMVMTTYDLAGEVQTGSFAMIEPSEAELARRERLQREG
jgi:dihydrofolate reductase